MIHGHKPNGHFFTSNEHGGRVERETHQCVHCQAMWEYKPGSGIERGFCMNCHGFVCGGAQCFAQQKWLIDMMQQRYNQTRSCVPLQEWNERIREKVEKLLPLDPGFTVTASGLIVPQGAS